MKLHQLPAPLALCLLAAATAPAEVRYVDLTSTNPTPPYTNWATAATNIQDAVDAAVAGDQVLVTNGFYEAGGRPGTGRVVVDKPVAVQSVNGPQFTAIAGSLGTRCVYMVNGVLLTGYTLTNGSVSFQGVGGGVAFAGSDATVSNCIITGCSAIAGGGAASVQSIGGPPGLNGGRLINCAFTRNGAFGHTYPFPTPAAGGAAEGCTLINCTLTGNNAAGPDGGGVGGASSCILQNCIACDNVATAANYSSCELNYCYTTPFNLASNSPTRKDCS
jgi:hypothetical protein